MSRIALIHGFAVGLTAPLVRRGFGPAASFWAFASAIEKGEAKVFRWGIECRVMPWQLLNLFFLHEHYLGEKKLTTDPIVQAEVAAFLAHEQPEVIVCHSMGSVMMAEYLKRSPLPQSVRAIVFVQSDLPHTQKVESTVPIYNLYCPWDPTLFFSSLNSLSWRSGIVPNTANGMINKFFPLTKPFNLHTSSIRDPKLVAFVNSL